MKHAYICIMATAAKALGADEVSFSVNDALTDILASMPGADTSVRAYTTGAKDYTIESASVTVDGVYFRAQRNERPCTKSELAATTGPLSHQHESSYRSAIVETA